MTKNSLKFFLVKKLQKVTNNPLKFYFWVKKLQNGPKSEKLSVDILYLLKINKTDRKVTCNLSKFYFWTIFFCTIVYTIFSQFLSTIFSPNFFSNSFHIFYNFFGKFFNNFSHNNHFPNPHNY